MLTVGVDLAAEPEGTALAWVEWRDGRAVVREVSCGADDAAVLGAIKEADQAGVDCPLGWPDAFVDFVVAHRAGSVAWRPELTGRAGRRSLALRVTDLVVRAETGLTPLSVSADRIGYVAMRCAGLLATLAQEGRPVDRSGAGPVAEVYPAACLKAWGLPHHGYKRPGDLAKLGGVVDGLLAAAPWLEVGAAEGLCRSRHDAADAVVAALAARAASLGLTLRPRTAEEERAAATEGWVAVLLPGTELAQLLD
jgi:predicted nuclease with RNAse H fold